MYTMVSDYGITAIIVFFSLLLLTMMTMARLSYTDGGFFFCSSENNHLCGRADHHINIISPAMIHAPLTSLHCFLCQLQRRD